MNCHRLGTQALPYFQYNMEVSNLATTYEWNKVIKEKIIRLDTLKISKRHCVLGDEKMNRKHILTLLTNDNEYDLPNLHIIISAI